MITENAVDTRPKNFSAEAEVESFLKAARKGAMGFVTLRWVLLTLPAWLVRHRDRRQNFRISSTWSCANPPRTVSFPLIVTVLAA